MQKKKCLTATDIESQTLIALPDRSLTAIIVPFSDLISAISLILYSCFFLTGFLRKTNSDSSYVKPRKLSNPVKEDIRAHISEITSQAKLGPDMSVPAHARRLQQEADFSPQSPLKTEIKSNGTVYRRRLQVKREHLPATYQRHAELLFEALENPDHELRQAAEQGLRGFAEAAVKNKGMSVNSAAQEFDVPAHFLLRWAKQMGIIPILLEGKGPGSATYIDREKARKAAEIYHEAKQLGIQPKKLLERMSSR